MKDAVPRRASITQKNIDEHGEKTWFPEQRGDNHTETAAARTRADSFAAGVQDCDVPPPAAEAGVDGMDIHGPPTVTKARADVLESTTEQPSEGGR